MFACCDQANISVDVDISQTLGLAEPTQVIIVLLRLLHDPPGPPLEMPDDAPDFSSSRLYQKRYDRSTVIPLPLITTTVFELLDKYILNSSIVDAVWLHVAAHAPTDPLQVYGFATLHGKEKIASWASQYVMPLASYRADEIKVIPTVEAYHKLVRLEALRLKSLKTMLLSEDIFPHGKLNQIETRSSRAFYHRQGMGNVPSTMTVRLHYGMHNARHLLAGPILVISDSISVTLKSNLGP